MTIDKNPLDLARLWAKKFSLRDKITGSVDDEALAAAEVITALPDEWIDADKLREILADQYTKHEGSDTKWINASTIEALLPTPPAPRTMADMTEEERTECQWMQASVLDEEYAMTGVIQKVRQDIVWLMFRSGNRNDYRLDEVVPRDDLPRLEWPDSEPEADDTREPEREADRQVTLNRSPRPEDVLDGEVWAVSDVYADGIGYRRSDQPSNPWFVSYPDLDGVRNWHVWTDDELVLLHRLVPEQAPTHPTELVTEEDYETAPHGTVVWGDASAVVGPSSLEKWNDFWFESGVVTPYRGDAMAEYGPHQVLRWGGDQ